MIKVSQLNGALEPLPIELTNGTKDVKISVPAGHNYAKGDFIKFTNLATDKVTFQGIEINKDKAYIIKEVTAGLNGSSKITFEADGAVATGNGLIGYANTQNNAGAIANAANTILGVDAKINHISKLFKGFGITTTQEYFNGLQPTYDAIQSTKNLADNPDRAHYSRPVTIYDSLGVSHTVMIGFVKLKENLWAAEVSVPQRPDGTYEVSGDHKITYGDISFDGNGQLYNPEEALTKDLTFSWNNGASPSTIKIDFGALIGTGDTGNVGLTQIAGDYDTKQIDTDGNPPGNLMGWYIRDDGSFVAKFDNSTEQVVGKIAVGHIPVLGELTDLGKGEYTTNSKSGDLILKTGIILSGGLAASDIDQTTKTIEMSQLATHQQFVARTLSVQRDVEQDLLRQLG
jgi:flagellar hook-basal body protein